MHEETDVFDSLDTCSVAASTTDDHYGPFKNPFASGDTRAREIAEGGRGGGASGRKHLKRASSSENVDPAPAELDEEPPIKIELDEEGDNYDPLNSDTHFDETSRFSSLHDEGDEDSRAEEEEESWLPESPTKSHKCKTCKRVFSDLNGLRKHAMKYHPTSNAPPRHRRLTIRRPRKYAARLGQTNLNELIIEFVKEVDSNPNCYQRCELCEVTMPAKKMEAHIKLWHGLNPDYTTNPKAEEVVVGQSQSKEEVFSGVFNCSKCKKEFKSEELLQDHIEIHKISPFHCFACLDVSTSAACLSNHVWLAHNKKADPARAKLRLRRKLNPITKSGLIRCMKCLRCFKTDAIDAHKELHRTSPYHCQFCGNVFYDEGKLRGHLGRFHRQLYFRMKSINPVDPLSVTVIPDSEKVATSPNENILVSDEEKAVESDKGSNDDKEDSYDDTDMDGDEDWELEDIIPKKRLKNTNAPRWCKWVFYSCPVCDKFYFRSDCSEDLCGHLEECPGLKCSSDDEKSSSSALQQLHCPKCITFKCPVTDKIDLGEHILSCSGEPETSANPALKRVPLENRLFFCDICPEGRYFRLNGFLHHYKIHAQRKLICTHCAKRFPHVEALSDHFRTAHAELFEATPEQERFTQEEKGPVVPWWCWVCNKRFSDEGERDAHFEGYHAHTEESANIEKSHICPTCTKGYAWPDELKLHQDTIHLQHTQPGRRQRFICDLCDDRCQNQKDLENHKRKKHRINLFMCETCGTECCSAATLATHMQLHEVVKKHQCDECPKSFTAAQYLRHHKYREHTPLDKKVNPQMCPHCDKPFHSMHYLRVHIAVVHEKKFKVFCHVCGTGAPNESTLKKHLYNKHRIGELKTWRCPEEGCTRIFRSLHFLQIHKDKHKGTPQFPCKYCGKAFYEKNHLRRHKQIHENAESKPFVCKICAKAFPVRNYLYIHMKSHQKDT